jgi:trimeric autotransporter adhesin
VSQPKAGDSWLRLIERTTMSIKTLKKRIALLAVAALGFGLVSTVPAVAVSYTWNLLDVGTISSNGTKLVTIPRDAIAVESITYLDDERVWTDTTNNASNEYEDARVCSFGIIPITCSGTDPFTNIYSRGVGSASTLKYSHQALASGGSAGYDLLVAYVPQEPTITRIVRNIDGLTASMTFSAPLINNGPAISDYEYSINGGTTWQSAGITTPIASLTPASRTITISTFGAKNVYDVVLRAVNSNGAGIISPVFNTGFTRAELVGSVTTVPFAAEGNAVATFAIDAFGVNADDSADIRFALTSQPSGSNASISTTSTGQGVTTGNLVNLTTSVDQGSDVFRGTSTATVTLTNSGGLLEGTYTISATPSGVMTQLGARVQTVRFTVTSRSFDGPRLESINTVAQYNNTGLIRDSQIVNVGARVQAGAGGAGTIRLRADLISFPTAAYVNTVAADGATNFLSAPSASADTNSNLVTYVGNFNDCAPGETSANCDSVTATAGTALVASVAKATFSFTPTVAGSYIMRVWQDANNNGLLDVNEVRSDVTVTVTAFPLVSPTYSKSIISKESSQVYTADETVIAPMGTGAAATKAARIRVTLNSTASTLAADVRMDGRATFPTISAAISGPGLIAISQAGNVANPTGRNVAYTITSAATDVVQNVFFVEVWNDGTNGVATITINVDGAAWTTEKVSFYGAPAKVTVAQNLKVAPAGTTVAFGCSANACAGGSIAATAAAVVSVVDSAGIAVPGATITATSSNTAVFSSTIAATESATVAGSYNTSITPVLGSTSGQSATMTYKATLGTASASSDAVTFKLGGAAASAAMSIGSATGVGEQNTVTFTAKDALGNAPFDAYHALTFASNISLTSSIGAVGDLPLTGTVLLVDGSSAAIKFFNPLVGATVNLTGTLAGAAISGSVTVSNSAIDAATDAAAEAIDAANAATDAANAAAEAADAATAAAQDAADAVAALSTQVSEMINALKKQITALTNLVIKIQKKVKA